MNTNHRPSPSLVVAMIALVSALGGTAWAAGLDKNTVKSKQIKDNSVKSADIADGSLGAVDIADGSLGAVEIADGSLGAADLEASLATRTLTAQRSLPVDNAPYDLMSVPGIGVVTASAPTR